jgi:ABC-type phosphate transport system substrate-binding protein
MKKISSMVFFFLLLGVTIEAVASGLVVIVNRANTTDSMTRQQVLDLYMGRRLEYPKGGSALPIDQSSDSEIRTRFYRQLVDKSIAQVNAYWARLLFTGRASPPRAMVDSRAVLKTVRDNRDAIGYVDSGSVDDTVKTVYEFE